MGSRQLGELLLRPTSLRSLAVQQPSLRLSYLRSFSTSPAANDQQNQTANPRTQQQQGQRAQRPLIRKTPSSNDNTSAPPSPSSTAPPTSAKPTQTTTSAAIDELFARSGLRTTQTSPTTSSASEFLSAHRSRRPFGASFSPPSSATRPKTNWDAMAFPDLGTSPTPTLPQFTQVSEKDIKYPRLNPTTGRTVELDAKRGRDIVRGLGMLGALVARNKVKSDMFRQRFHERPGLRRKRLKSERWRARFKKEFTGAVQRVAELTRKGW